MTARKTTRATPAAPKPVKKFIVLDDEFDRPGGMLPEFDTLDAAKKAIVEYVKGDDYNSTLHIVEVVATALCEVTPTFHEGFKK